MKKYKFDLKFDIKSMGIVFYIPIIVSILTFFYFIYLSKSDTKFDTALALPVIEFIIVPLVCIWILYIFYDYYENDGIELLLTYPLSNFEHGFIRIITFIILYIIFNLGLFIFISYETNASILLLIIQYMSQLIFISGLAFFLLTIFRNISISMTIVAFYVGTEFLTKGQLFPWYHVFFFNEKILNFYEVINKSILSIIIGLAFIIVGGDFLRNAKESENRF